MFDECLDLIDMSNKISMFLKHIVQQWIHLTTNVLCCVYLGHHHMPLHWFTRNKTSQTHLHTTERQIDTNAPNTGRW